ncbi:hypothetical protein VTO73DRAFT_8036 [Trametes versicolor]
MDKTLDSAAINGFRRKVPYSRPLSGCSNTIAALPGDLDEVMSKALLPNSVRNVPSPMCLKLVFTSCTRICQHRFHAPSGTTKMASPVYQNRGLENLECHNNTNTPNGVVTAPACDSVGWSSDKEELPGDSTSVRNARTFGATRATEFLRDLYYANPGSFVQRTISQDLQSFYWVIIYAAFKHTVDDIASARKSTTNGIPGFEHDFFEWEFGRLFSASSAIGLIQQRDLAFSAEHSGPPGKARYSDYPTTYAGIRNLAACLRSKEPAFADWISMIWMLLRECEPRLILSSGEIPSKLIKFVNACLAKPDAVVGPGTKVISSDYAKRLDHAQVIGAFELGLEVLADGEDASDEEGSELAQVPVDITDGDF